MIIRFEFKNTGKAFTAAMPAPLRKEERVWVSGEQFAAGEIFWEIREEEDSPGSLYGYGFDDRKWDQYVVLVKYHVRSVKGDFDSPLVPEGRRWPV